MQIFNNYRELLHKFYTLVAYSLSLKSWKFCCIYQIDKITMLLIMTPGSFDVIKHCLNWRLHKYVIQALMHIHSPYLRSGLITSWRLRLLNRLTCHPHVTKTWHYARTSWGRDVVLGTVLVLKLYSNQLKCSADFWCGLQFINDPALDGYFLLLLLIILRLSFLNCISSRYGMVWYTRV